MSETLKRQLADALAAYQQDDLVRLDGLMDEIDAHGPAYRFHAILLRSALIKHLDQLCRYAAREAGRCRIQRAREALEDLPQRVVIGTVRSLPFFVARNVRVRCRMSTSRHASWSSSPVARWRRARPGSIEEGVPLLGRQINVDVTIAAFETGAQRRQMYEAERWCRAARTVAVNQALTPQGRRVANTRGTVPEYRCLPDTVDPRGSKGTK